MIEASQISDQGMVIESCPPLTSPAKGGDEETTETLPTLQPGELNKEQDAFGIDQSSPICPVLKTGRNSSATETPGTARVLGMTGVVSASFLSKDEVKQLPTASRT